MGIFENYINFNNQSYSEYYSTCKSEKTLFVDPSFLSNDISISKTNTFGDLSDVVWKRPMEICTHPRLYIDESISILKGDITNSSLPVCFMTIRKKDVLKKIIPDIANQEWNEKKAENYNGIFKFRFWKDGEWIEIIVDDYLPTRNGKLLTITTSNDNEFWVCLLEKAFAKLNGSYELCHNHTEEEILLNLTGGVPELLYHSQMSSTDLPAHYDLLNHEVNNGDTIIVVTSKYNSGESAEDNHGLTEDYKCHITALRQVNIKNTSLSQSLNTEEIKVIRLCDPSWVKSWNGSLSESSDQWNLMPSTDKKRLKFSYSNGGDFWMTFSDFMKYFDRVIFIRQLNMSVFSLKTRWHTSSGNEIWYGACENTDRAIEGRGGGGQFYFEVTHSKSDSVLIHVLQKCQKSMQVPMAIIVFQVEKNRHTVMFSCRWGRLFHQFHIDQTRSAGIRCVLPTGCYIVKPYIKECRTDQLYYHLRVFSTEPNNGRFLLTEPIKKSPMMCFCIENECTVITRVRVVKAYNIARPSIKTYNVFCQIKCEDITLETTPINDTREFLWEEEFLIYRASPGDPITFKLFNKCTLLDDYFGEVEVHYDSKSANNDPVLMKFNLTNSKGAAVPGVLELAFWHTNSYVNL